MLTRCSCVFYLVVSFLLCIMMQDLLPDSRQAATLASGVASAVMSAGIRRMSTVEVIVAVRTGVR
jgi:hypothetical protein